MELSVVICVFNEENNIAPLIQSLRSNLHAIDYEVVFVDDGSTDHTVMHILQHADERIKLVELRMNYGQSTALAAGIDHAQGEFIVTMDGDLQNDPEDIPAMLAMARGNEWDVVAGVRKNRQDGFFLRKFPSRIANFMIRNITGVHLKDYGCTLKVFRRDIAKTLGLYGELHRFIPVLAKLQGARITQVDVKHHPRQYGKSKYGINRTFKVMADLLLMVFFQKYMQKAMHLFGIPGLLMFFAGVIINLYLLFLKIMGGDIWGKPLLMLGVLLTLGGIQLISLGIVVEIQVRTYYESQGKKTYTIRRIKAGKDYHKKDRT